MKIRYFNISPLILFMLLVLGFFYRFILMRLVYQLLIYDMDYYRIIAEKMMQGEIVADILGKTFGYPAFLAFLFSIFGKGNFLAVKIVQIFLDLGIAVVIFRIARTQFGKTAGWISFVLVLFSPITAAYAGLILPEVLTMFLVSMILLILVKKQFLQKPIWWITFGGLLGYWLFTRFQYYYFIFFIIILLGHICFKGGRRIGFMVITFLFVLVCSSYTLFANFRNFKVISIITPKSTMWSFLYLNYFGIQYPELLSETEKTPVLLNNIFGDYFHATLEKNYDKVDSLIASHKSSFLQEFPLKWPIFLINVFKNFLLLWDKRILAPYTDPFHPNDVWILRTGNIVLLGMFVTGIIRYVSKVGKHALRSPLFLFTTLLFVYMALFFSVVSNESRHTIVFYPLVYLWGGSGIAYWIKKVGVKS